MLALSIREPWASLIVYGGKDIENRTWRTDVRGPVLIHAARKSTPLDFYYAKHLADRIGTDKRLLADGAPFFRGGIIGTAVLVDCVRTHPSPWFEGPWGFVFEDARPLPFHPWRGQLGFFAVAGPLERYDWPEAHAERAQP